MFTRYALVTGALLLTAWPATAAEVSRYLPEDTEVVAAINVRQLLGSPLVKKFALEQLKAALAGNPDGQKLLDAIGLDPFKDIDSVLVAGPGKDLQNKAVVIVSGTFDLDRIHKIADEVVRADAEALAIHKEGNLRIIEGKGKNGGPPFFAALVDRNTLIAAQTRGVVVEAAKGVNAKAPRVKKNLQVLIQSSDDRQSAWFAALATSEIKDVLKNNPQTAGLAEKVTAFRGAANVTGEVQTAIAIHATDVRAADEVRRLVEALKGILAFAAQGNEQYGPLISDVLEVMKVSAQRNVVIVGGRMSEAQIDKSLKKASKP